MTRIVLVATNATSVALCAAATTINFVAGRWWLAVPAALTGLAAAYAARAAWRHQWN